ncbi:MAG TPA: NusA-like transcription termination signal-binding factor [Methanoregulaceae archaeon]|nr:NusA-like transcription termination signal-binding factor [Methanoregulaceae archaeon]
MDRSIGFKERRYIEELRILTRSTAVDCLIDERFDRVIYVIRPGDMGLAIGRKGENIQRLSRQLGRRIEMVEFAKRPEAFIANIIRPAELAGLAPGDDGKVDLLLRRRDDLGIVIGRNGCTIEKVRLLLRRFFDLEVDGVRVAPGAEAVPGPDAEVDRED